MRVSAAKACELINHLVVEIANEDVEFSRIDDSRDFREDSLVFVSDLKNFSKEEHGWPSVIVTNEAIAAELAQEARDKNVCVVIVRDVRLALALIKQEYADYDASDPEWEPIHDSAVVHKSAKLGKNVRVGPNTVIGENVIVGDNTQIRANCVIEHGATIGSNVIINNLVNVGYDCSIGDGSLIRPGVIIGNEGFGFAQDTDKRYHRIPHTGRVVLGENVLIGSNCNIDRGTYGETYIGDGTKIDALCHVGHNVQIGENVLFVAQTGVAGSTKIGDRVLASGQTGIIDHMTVGDDVVLLHRCGVVQDIPGPGVFAGKPARPYRDYIKTTTAMKEIEKLKKKISDLESK